MGGKIIISPVSGAAARKAIGAAGGAGFGWAYLGEDVSKLIFLEKAIGTAGKRIEMAGILQGIAGELRGPYIEYIGKLSGENNSLMWWAGRLSEKNPAVSKAFLHICYVRACGEIMGQNPGGTVVFFTDEKDLPEAMRLNVREKVVCMGEGLIGGAGRRIGGAGKFLAQKAWFLLSNFYKMIASGRAAKARPDLKAGSFVLIHTWLHERSFGANGKYREAYFGNLRECLEGRGEKVVLVPSVVKTSAYGRIMDGIAKSSVPFLVPHSLLEVGDVLDVLFACLGNKPSKRAYPLFEGMDISTIINADLESDWIENRMATDLLMHRLVKKMKARGIEISRVIYTYENHCWEKAFCLALREHYPSARLVGYQHATISRMHLNYFFSREELGLLPFPDLVVTGGGYAERLLLESGYPKGKLAAGGAIKYPNLHKGGSAEGAVGAKARGGKPSMERVGGAEEEGEAGKGRGRKVPNILITPSAARDGAELIWKMAGAFKGEDGYRLIIKCHPLTPFSAMSKYLGGMELPGNFTVADEPFAELLERADVLVYTNSTTCIEAISRGVPAVHVESGLMVGLDPLDSCPEARESARTPEEIRACVERAVGLGWKGLEKRRKEWKGLAEEMLGAADGRAYALFLE